MTRCNPSRSGLGGRRSRHGLGLAAAVLVLLAGCLGSSPQGPAYRNVDQPLSVTTRGSESDVSGPWFVRGYFSGDQSVAMVTFLPDWQGRPAVALLRSGCDISGDCETAGEVWRRETLGMNRWRIQNPKGGDSREIWLVWTDEGFRTAAIGTPDGSFGWILDRKATGGADRITAAREILQFNGYDTHKMVLR